jgi:hypothetical protein
VADELALFEALERLTDRPPVDAGCLGDLTRRESLFRVICEKREDAVAVRAPLERPIELLV